MSQASLLRVLVVDDEPLARSRLCYLLAEIDSPKMGLVTEAASAEQAYDWLTHNCCDVVLLDIHMPGQDGLVFAQQLQQLLPNQGPAVVFVTAHAEHAVHAFELNAVDYLTKPVRQDRLQMALSRVLTRREAARALPTGVQVPAPPLQAATALVVSQMGRKIKIALQDILYLKAELKYVTLRTATHTHVLDDALADLEQRLGASFLRIHRNALVAYQALQLLERRPPCPDEGLTAEAWRVKVAPVGEWLAVSRRQVSAVKEAIARGAV
jgi:two-component system, LytTR family, response regulator AlgR